MVTPNACGIYLKLVMASTYLLPGCPKAPHCVSSETDIASQRVAPYLLNNEDDRLMLHIAEILSGLAGLQIEYSDDQRIEAVCETALFRFKDDLALMLDSSNRCIQVRSCSRIGYYDFGANRRRVERIRRQLQQHQLLK